MVRILINYLSRFKATLFVLLRELSFKLAVPAEVIEAAEGVLTKPIVVDDKDAGFQMPLIVSRVK